MNESILNTIKRGVMVDPSYTAFDADLITHINTVFMILSEIGVGPEIPFAITGDSETWNDFFNAWTWDPFKLTNDSLVQYNQRLAAVKSYMIMRVKMLFDPPTNGTVMQSTKENIAELEWRLNVHVDPEDTFSEDKR